MPLLWCTQPALLEQVFQAMEAGTVNKHDWSDKALQTWNKWPLMHTKHNTTSVADDPAVHPVCVFEVDKQSSWL